MKSRLLLSLSLALTAGLALAATPVGTWTGKITITKMPVLPAGAPPQQKAMAQQFVAAMSKMRLMLNLKSDKTYVMTMVGGPTQPPHTGKWSQKGNVITTTSATEKGPPQNLTLSADGKTMTLIAPGNQGKVVFTR